MMINTHKQKRIDNIVVGRRMIQDIERSTPIHINTLVDIIELAVESQSFTLDVITNQQHTQIPHENKFKKEFIWFFMSRLVSRPPAPSRAPRASISPSVRPSLRPSLSLSPSLPLSLSPSLPLCDARRAAGIILGGGRATWKPGHVTFKLLCSSGSQATTA